MDKGKKQVISRGIITKLVLDLLSATLIIILLILRESDFQLEKIYLVKLSVRQ